jgi:hypothetical protein
MAIMLATMVIPSVEMDVVALASLRQGGSAMEAPLEPMILALSCVGMGKIWGLCHVMTEIYWIQMVAALPAR